MQFNKATGDVQVQGHLFISRTKVMQIFFSGGEDQGWAAFCLSISNSVVVRVQFLKR